MVMWWKCTECNEIIDEFCVEFKLEEKDKKRLCKECRKKDKKELVTSKN